MIIQDSLYFDMQIGEYSNFLSIDDVLVFKLTEYSGAAGIIIEMSFRTNNERIKDLILENNLIQIKIGSSEDNYETYNVYPADIDPNQDASNQQYVITFSAAPNLSFLRERNAESVEGTSKDVINHISKEYFGKEIKSTVIPFEEKKHWVRSYKTGATFMLDTWLHMYLGKDSCPVLWIDKNGQVYLEDLEVIKKGDTKVKFVPNNPKSSNKAKEIKYLNNFKPDSYKFASNMETGYGNITTINDIASGSDEIILPKNIPDLASTTEVEKSLSAGYTQIENFYQNDNTHAHYQEAYNTNKARLIRLSSIVGDLQIYGFHPEISVLDLVEVDDGSKVHSGKYIVNTKSLNFSYNSAPLTIVTVCRDNKNRIEDFDINKDKVNNFFKLINNNLTKVLQYTRNLRRVVVMARQVLDGTFVTRVQTFLSSFKYSMLTSFSMFGVTLNFNSAGALFDSLKASGNSLINQIIDTHLPYPFNYVLRNYALEQPSLRTLVNKLLYYFSPYSDFRDLIVEIQGLFADLTNQASELSDNTYNYISATEYSTNQTSRGDDMSLQDNQKRVRDITDEFISNTEGVDVPIPQTDLTESEALLPDNELKDLMADKTVTWLIEQGYLNGVDNFKKILLGEESLDFNTITQINNNIGNMLYARYWGTFNEVEEITDFFITNSFKDIYVTVPTTKIINALKGAKIFIALPQSEKDLAFYINNKEVEMETIEGINIGLYTQGGAVLLYNVYLSTESFNSNSVVLEVRKTS